MSNPSNAPVRKDSRHQEMNQFMVWVNRLGIYVVVVLLAVVGQITAPGKFFTLSNFRTILQAVSLIGICSVGLAFVVYSANFNDMSLPMTIAFSGMVSVQLLQFGIVVSLLGGIAAGLLMGVVNGFVIGKLRAHPIIWSMAFNFVMSGIVRYAWRGTQIYPDVIAEGKAVDIFYGLSRTYIAGVPLMVIVMLVLFVLGHIVMTRTVFGNQLKIIGSNYDVGRLSGINCARVVFIAYLINAFCASICGIFLASVSRVGAYYNGEGYDFQCVTAVLLGGMTLAGGQGSMIGVFGGVVTVGLLSNVMNLMGIPTFNQYLVQGLVFLLIVWITTNSARKLGKS
jgi:ribose/xylose/arabinose/galactoside ABC-type transport system permease subunit